MRKFEYTDTDGIKKEEPTFTVSDFVTVPTPNSPVMTNSIGLIPGELISGDRPASRLVVERVCSERLYRGDLVRAVGEGKVAVADSSLTSVESGAIGICLNEGEIGQVVFVMIIGIYKDPSLDSLLPGRSVFLEKEGALTDEVPSTPDYKYQVEIGKTLGDGEILIFIQKPISLGG